MLSSNGYRVVDEEIKGYEENRGKLSSEYERRESNDP